MEEHSIEANKLGLYKWLADEGNEADRIKRDTPVMVVMGNPPYSGESRNTGKWIQKLVDTYKLDDKGEKIPDTKWVNNDYVKFIRLGQEFVNKNKEGILAYINDNSFLDSLTFKGMRWNLLRSFDEIYIIDLHGNSRGGITTDGTKDENVFDIMQGVSINIFVKAGKKLPDELADVYHYDLFGVRQDKYDYLITNLLSSLKFSKLKPHGPNYFFVPKDFSLKDEYDKGINIQNIFTLNGVGICSKRDDFTMHCTKESLVSTISNFISLENEVAHEYYKLGKDTDWKILEAKKDLTNSPDFTKIARTIRLLIMCILIKYLEENGTDPETAQNFAHSFFSKIRNIAL